MNDMQMVLKPILDKAKEEYEKFRSCSRHYFEVVSKANPFLEGWYKCRHCDTRVTHREKMLYEQGFQHAFDLMDRCEERKNNV